MNGLIANLLLHSLKISIPASLLALLTPILVKRFAAKWTYYAWLAVLLCFLFPASLTVETPLVISLPQEILGYTAPLHSSEIAVPGAVERDAINVLQSTTESTQTHSSAWNPLWIIWILGATATVCYHGWRHSRYIKAVKRWKQPINASWPYDLLAKEKAQLGIKKKIELCICPCIVSPVLTGIMRPSILLPYMPDSRDELSLILKHELVHYARRDGWYKLITLIALSVHWFNPIMYLIARITTAVCEISCDQAVVNGADYSTRQLYGMAVLQATEKKVSFAQTMFSASMHKKVYMKKRIEGIMDMKRTKKGAAIILVAVTALLVMMLSVGFATSSAFPYIDNTRMKEPIRTGMQEGDSSTDGYIIWPEGTKGIQVASFVGTDQPFRVIDLRYRHDFDVKYRISQGETCTIKYLFDYDYILHGPIPAQELNDYVADCFGYFEEVFANATYDQIADTHGQLVGLYQQCLDYVESKEDPRIDFRYYPSGLTGNAPIYLPFEDGPLPNTF